MIVEYVFHIAKHDLVLLYSVVHVFLKKSFI